MGTVVAQDIFQSKLDSIFIGMQGVTGIADDMVITCGNRIIVPREMRPEMLQYIHKGHQHNERCLLRARNNVFWPKMTYDVQQLIEVYHMPGVWEVTTNHRHYPGTTSFPMAHIDDRYVLLEKNGLSDSGRCILNIHHSKETAKSHLSSCVHRAIYDCNRIRPTPHN